METIQSVMTDFKTRIDFEANPSFVTRFNGVNYEHTRDLKNMHTSTYITKILIDHSWSHRSKRDHSHHKAIHPSLLKLIKTTTGPSMHDDTTTHQALEEEFGFDYRATLG